MPKGTVKWYDPEKGYGFIESEETNDDLFVHRSAITVGSLYEGDKVDFEIAQSEKGPRAENVQVTETSSPTQF